MRRTSTVFAAAIVAATVAACGSSSHHDSPAPVVKTYLTALGNGNGARACGVLSAALQDQQVRLARAHRVKVSSCASALSALHARLPVYEQINLRGAKVTKVSQSGDTGVVTVAHYPNPIKLHYSGGRWVITSGT
jgi:hypothetical protein